MKLSLSIRQIDRLIQKYKEKGKSAFIHGNRDKKPVNKLDSTISDTIILLYTTKYYDFNFAHFKDFLEKFENIKVSYSYLYNLLTKNNKISQYAHKKTKRAFKKKELMDMKLIKPDQTEDEIETIVSHELSLEDSHPRISKPKYFGETIELDGSIHNWFGNKKTCLHLAIDKATSTVIGGYFDNQETLNGYYNVFYQLLTKYGVPYSFFTDNRTVFNYNSLNPEKRTSEKDVLTQFGYACKQLGVGLDTSSVSQAKGTVERANGTFQRRLVSELRLFNITDIDQANDYLINTFIPYYNEHFSIDYTRFESVFNPSPEINKIYNTLAIIEERKIDSGASIKYKNKYYQPYHGNQLKCFAKKTECLVINNFVGDLLVSIDDQIYELKELPRNKRFSKELDSCVSEPKEKKKYVPAANHPWRLDSFRKHVNQCHNEHKYSL